MPLGDKIALWLFMRNVVYMEFVAVRLLPPVTTADVIVGRVAGTAGRKTLKETGADHGPHPAWQARTFRRYSLDPCRV